MRKEGDCKFQKNQDGPTLGYVSASILAKDGLYFKDFEKDGELYPYEDWRLSPGERAKDLAGRLSVEEMAGLMMYSPHQMVPSLPGMPFKATYGGKDYDASLPAFTVSDQLEGFLRKEHIRHVLLMNYQDTETAVCWNNALQAICEEMPHGIPANICSDPRHGAGSAGAEYRSEGTDTSKWPEGLAMAATFDPDLCREAAGVMAKEYRALGIATALSPQVDLGTEPRWMRIEDTFGASPALVTAMSRAYCEGMQEEEGEDGWGKTSVNAMAKHWPGGGPCEGGRDAHYPFGKFAVYPGHALKEHLKPFLEGAFALEGKTKKVAAVMPYYTVSWDVDPSGDQVGNSYSRYIIKDMLREKAGFEGVICTDWGITADPEPTIDSFSSRCYGVHALSEAERHLRIIDNGVDQFGGNSSLAPILEAYRLGCERDGEEAMHKRFMESAVRILTNIFQCGLFENPYLLPEESKQVVGSLEHCEKGIEAQKKSVVLLKNQGVLPLVGRGKAYVPDRHIEARKNFFRMPQPAMDLPGADKKALKKYLDIAKTPEEADYCLCFIESPLSDGYDEKEGYRPVTLQYRPYKAETAREESIAGGDFREKEKNRSYKGKTNRAFNERDLDLVIEAKKVMGEKPVIVCIRMHNPCVLAELEPYADAILVQFGVQQDVLLDILTGKAQPSGLLPVQLPDCMETVERHCEDLPFDMACYQDSAGNTYDFGFGLNWQGRIIDERTKKWGK